MLPIAVLLMASCNDFLDEVPDNRVVINNQDKVRKILVSAYPRDNFATVSELSSDNVIDEGEGNPNNVPIYEEMAYWKDLTRTDSDDTKTLWERHYNAIAHSNTALEAIDKIGKEQLRAERAEALITRAYSHFVLVNVFGQHYNEATSSTDLGVPYVEKPENTLNPKYKRASVKEVYEKINRDIELALPYIDDNIYEQPRYHFNRKAAYAFAARFNLYYGKWEKAKKYADKALEGSSLINWGNLGGMSFDIGVRSREYIKLDGVFLLQTDASSLGLLFGAYFYGARINHTRLVAGIETAFSVAPWGKLSAASYKSRPFTYSANNYQKVNFPKSPYFFEYTDFVQRIGFRRVVIALFTSDETLLVRAEANIMLKNNQEAMNDLNKWSKNFYAGNRETTIDKVSEFYERMPYSSVKELADVTQKKKLNPAFTIDNKTQENMLHYLLQSRRILTLHEGLRWFDIKRYGIEVPRFFQDASNEYVLKDALLSNDKRKAIQVPKEVISSGIEANPR